MGKKIAKFLFTLGILALLGGISYYVYKDYINNSTNNYFLVLEIKAKDMVITIEPRKKQALVDEKTIKLNNRSIKEFNDFYVDYVTQLKDLEDNDKLTYLWTINYQDKDLKEHYYAADSYPDSWTSFTKRVDKLLDDIYLSKEEELKEEEDLSLKSVTEIVFDDSCRAYSCNYSLKLDNKTYPLTFKRNSSGEDVNQELIYNDKTIIKENFMCGGITRLSTIKDTFVVYYHKGCKVSDNEIAIYDANGKEIIIIKNLKEYPGLYITNEEYEINNNKITFNMTNLINEKLVIDGVEIDPCLEENQTKYSIDENFIIAATFEMRYVNSGYLDPIISSKTTILDTKLLASCTVMEETQTEE